METKTVSKPKIKDFSINRETYDHANKEKNIFTPGKKIELFNIDGINIGIIICFDWIFPDRLGRLCWADGLKTTGPSDWFKGLKLPIELTSA